MEQREDDGRFKKGHKGLHGMLGKKMSKEAKEKVSASLKGLIGEKARCWKGMNAGYVAKHLWIVKHYGKASRCEKCGSKTAKRYEWANISGEYKRERTDYMELCPSCHRRKDYGDKCKRGHEFTAENTRITKEGWRACRACATQHRKNYRNAKRNIQGPNRH